MVQTLTPDTVVDRRYKVMNRIGSGGMADVYCAQDLQLGRRVALKLLHRRFAEDEEFVERFRREASAAAGLQHPNVVQVYDRGEWDGTYYIAMEYLPGPTLKELVREEGPMAPDRAIDIAIGVLKAIRFAHRRGIVHRDIKPHNAMLDAEGRVKVTDFGIARAGASDMTETGSIMGTAQYLSPEQAQGHAVDERSDLYSVGILLYELLTGRVPFEGESAVTIALKQVAAEPAAPSRHNPAVPHQLEDVVLRALAKDPARRYQDADGFIQALQAARGAPVAKRGVTRVVPSTGSYPVLGLVDDDDPIAELRAADRRNRAWLWWLLALLVVAGLAVAAFLELRPVRTPVPDVVGHRGDVATQELQDADFEVHIEHVQALHVRRNRVASQRPRAGDLATRGATVTIVVSSGPGQRSIPDVADTAAGPAAKRIRAAGFKLKTEHAFSEDVARGTVIGTRPQGRTLFERGRTVVLVVSRGPERVAVPSVDGRGQTSAEAAIRAAALQVAVVEEETDAATAGTVIGQDPAPGTPVPKNTTVTLTVAKAPTPVAVPPVEGLTVNQAVDALTGAGFAVRQRTTAVDSADQDGIVVVQRPAAGAQLRPGSRVAIRVGKFTPPANLDPDPGETPGGGAAAGTDTGTGAGTDAAAGTTTTTPAGTTP